MSRSSRGGLSSESSHFAHNSTLGSRDSDRAGELRKRLRQGSSISFTRSVLSRSDIAIWSEDDFMVDVGEGISPNIFEQLLARLEQHGLRRCNYSAEDILELTISAEVARYEANENNEGATSGLPEGQASSTNHAEQDAVRQSYYYLCVPCEMRLTTISTSAATHTMLEDVHYHFSSATHRSTASWMAAADIDATLVDSPLLELTGYIRIFINGIPLLISRRPGGGDMFYPLPHEQERLTAPNKLGKHLPLSYETLNPRQENSKSKQSHDTTLLPLASYSSDVCYWYRPLSSLCNSNQSYQLISYKNGSKLKERQAKKNIIRSSARRMINVHHIPLTSYKLETHLDTDIVPIIPVIFPIFRRRIGKKYLEHKDKFDGKPQSDTDGHRIHYIQPHRPYIMERTTPGDSAGDGSSLNRCLVEAEGIYRIALLSERDQANMEHEEVYLSAEEQNMGISSLSVAGQHTAPLTQELLKKLAQEPSSVSRASYSPSGSSYSASTSSFDEKGSPALSELSPGS